MGDKSMDSEPAAATARERALAISRASAPPRVDAPGFDATSPTAASMNAHDRDALAPHLQLLRKLAPWRRPRLRPARAWVCGAPVSTEPTPSPLGDSASRTVPFLAGCSRSRGRERRAPRPVCPCRMDAPRPARAHEPPAYGPERRRVARHHDEPVEELGDATPARGPVDRRQQEGMGATRQHGAATDRRGCRGGVSVCRRASRPPDLTRHARAATAVTPTAQRQQPCPQHEEQPRPPGSGLPGSGPPGSGLPGSGPPGSGPPGSGLPGSGLPGSGLPGSGPPGSGFRGVGARSLAVAAIRWQQALSGGWWGRFRRCRG